MNKIKENASLIRNILMIVLASVLVITSMALYFQSIEAYDGGFDSNLDYVIATLISIAILAFTIYAIVCKDKNNLNGAKNTLLSTTSFLVTGYSLGKFIKGLVKGKEFAELQIYFYAGIVALILVSICVINYIESKKD